MAGEMGTQTGEVDSTDASCSTRAACLTGRMRVYEHGVGCY